MACTAAASLRAFGLRLDAIHQVNDCLRAFVQNQRQLVCRQSLGVPFVHVVDDCSPRPTDALLSSPSRANSKFVDAAHQQCLELSNPLAAGPSSAR